MNIVMLSPHFPENFRLFSVHLRSFGATVLGIADEAQEALHPDLQRCMAAYYRVSDMHVHDELLRGLGWFTHRFGKIDRLDSHAEYWLETEARLRDDFNIPGFKTADLPPIKRKSLMKRVFQGAGVPVARGVVARDPVQVRAFVDEVGFPLVAKPDIGVGASKTWKIASHADLEAFLAHPLDDYFLEEFVQGEIETFDGLVDRQGQVVFWSSMRYSRGVMEVVNDDADIYYYTVREIPADLEALGRKVVAAFGIKERFFHFEFFRTPEGRLVALEVNMRPPGGLSVDMMNFANDMDVYREWANIVVNGRFESTFGWPWFCLYAGRKFNRSYRLSHEDVLRRFGSRVVGNQPMPGIFARALGDFGYLLRSPDLGEVVEMAGQIQETT